jgi:hypothetical protein
MDVRFHRRPPEWARLLWWLDRTRYLWFAGLVLLYLAGSTGVWRITPDSALHLIYADSVHHGRGMVDFAGQSAKVAPGLAYTVAAVGGQPGWATAMVMLVFAFACLLLTYRLILLNADRPTAVLITILLGTNRLFYEHAMGLLTELPFMAGLLILLIGHERRVKQYGPIWLAFTLIVTGLTLMTAYRSVGVVVALAYVLAEIIRLSLRSYQRRSGLMVVAIGLAAAVVAWFVFPAVRTDTGLFFGAVRGENATTLGTNLWQLLTESINEAILGQDLHPVVAIPVSLLVIAFGLSLARVRLLWAALVGVFAVQWLVFQPADRYVLPLLPVLLVGVWQLLITLSSRFPKAMRDTAFSTLIILLIGANLVGIVRTIGQQREEIFLAEYRDGQYLPVVEAGRWIDGNLPDDAYLWTTHRIDAVLSWHCRRPVLQDPNQLAVDAPSLYILGPLDDQRMKGLRQMEWTLGRSLYQLESHQGETWTVQQVHRQQDAVKNAKP